MATDQLIARDAVIRQAAFDHVRALQSRDLTLSHEEIARGFMFEGQRWPLWNPQRGIFKPRGMPFLLSIRTVLLSIRTVFPRKGGRVWDDDQRRVHGQIFAGEEELDYAVRSADPATEGRAYRADRDGLAIRFKQLSATAANRAGLRGEPSLLPCVAPVPI